MLNLCDLFAVWCMVGAVSLASNNLVMLSNITFLFASEIRTRATIITKSETAIGGDPRIGFYINIFRLDI